MQFLFQLFNHTELGRRSLEDVVTIIGHQLAALGHGVKWEHGDETFLPGDAGINLIFEGFTDGAVDVLADARARGARFVIIATEEPTERGFNYGTERDFVARQRNFHKGAALAEGIVHLVPGENVTGWYAQFAPAAYTDLGYAPSLIRPNDAEPDYEFGFYGAITDRRDRIITRLANRTNMAKAVKLMGDFRTQAERDRDMRRAKVIVQIRKNKRMGLVSSSRCNTALCLGRPVVAEPHLLSKPWDEVVRFAKSEESFLDEAMLVRSMWRGVYADQFAKFKRLFSPEACIGRALKEIGVLERAAAA